MSMVSSYSFADILKNCSIVSWYIEHIFLLSQNMEETAEASAPPTPAAPLSVDVVSNSDATSADIPSDASSATARLRPRRSITRTATASTDATLDLEAFLAQHEEAGPSSRRRSASRASRASVDTTRDSSAEPQYWASSLVIRKSG